MKTYPQILKLDVAGNPRSWITHERAAYYYTKGLVAWSMSSQDYRLNGGISRMTGNHSFLDLNTIIAVRESKGKVGGKLNYNPNAHKVTLNNRTLFRRDQHVCAYCGEVFHERDLTCDHVIPRASGGKDVWTNVVTSCGPCNRNKGHSSLSSAGLSLLYVPYEPNKAEHLILMNRNILSDQMEFLKSRVPSHSRILNPINDKFYMTMENDVVQMERSDHW